MDEKSTNCVDDQSREIFFDADGEYYIYTDGERDFDPDLEQYFRDADSPCEAGILVLEETMESGKANAINKWINKNPAQVAGRIEKIQSGHPWSVENPMSDYDIENYLFDLLMSRTDWKIWIND